MKRILQLFYVIFLFALFPHIGIAGDSIIPMGSYVKDDTHEWGAGHIISHYLEDLTYTGRQ